MIRQARTPNSDSTYPMMVETRLDDMKVDIMIPNVTNDNPQPIKNSNRIGGDVCVKNLSYKPWK